VVDLDPKMMDLWQKWYREDMGAQFLYQVHYMPDTVFSMNKKIESAADFVGFKLEVSGSLKRRYSSW